MLPVPRRSCRASSREASASWESCMRSNRGCSLNPAALHRSCRQQQLACKSLYRLLLAARQQALQLHSGKRCEAETVGLQEAGFCCLCGKEQEHMATTQDKLSRTTPSDYILREIEDGGMPSRQDKTRHGHALFAAAQVVLRPDACSQSCGSTILAIHRLWHICCIWSHLPTCHCRLIAEPATVYLDISAEVLG